MTKAATKSLAFASLFALVSAATKISATRPFGVITDVEAFSKQSYDYLIVGGGSAGLVLANRLSANPTYTVGVVEAGYWYPDEPLINVPGLFGRARNNATFDWLIKTTPQPGIFNRSLEQPRGKFLGGSSGLTYHNYARASRQEYDAWAELGNPGWDWEHLYPYFTKTDDVTPGPVGWLANNTEVPGLANMRDGAVGGPVKVGFGGNDTAATQYVAEFHKALVNRGGFVNPDPEGGNSTGSTLNARNVDPRTSTRSYATNSYLEPVLDRKNLLVLTGAHATKILFDQSTITAPKGKNSSLLATGIQYAPENSNQRWTATADREVILSAGSLKSPQLLELSGIGNKTLLQSLNIPVIMDFPEVGENLQDHLEWNSDYLLREDAPFPTWDVFRNDPAKDKEQWEIFQKNGTGRYNASPNTLSFYALQTWPEAFNVTELVAELDEEIKAAWDTLSPIRKKQFGLQRQHLVEGKTTQLEISIVPQGGIAASPYPPLPGRSYINIVTFLLRPYSAGNAHINTTDPFAAPLVDPKYNQFSFDWKVGAQWTAHMRKIMMDTEPMKSYVEAPAQPDANTTTLKQWDDFCRNYTISVWHPVGTTSMASKELGGVVNHKMQLYGTQNVRIVDAGSIPINPATHTVATVWAMSEKIADDIIADRRLPESPQVPARTLEDLQKQFGVSQILS